MLSLVLGRIHAVMGWLSVMCSLMYVLPVDRVRVCRCSILVIAESCFVLPILTVLHVTFVVLYRYSPFNRTKLSADLTMRTVTRGLELALGLGFTLRTCRINAVHSTAGRVLLMFYWLRYSDDRYTTVAGVVERGFAGGAGRYAFRAGSVAGNKIV